MSPLLSRAKQLGPRYRSGIRRATTCPYRNLKTADRDNLAPCDIGNCCHTSWGVIKAMLLAPVNGGIPISQGVRAEKSDSAILVMKAAEDRL